MSFQNAQSPDGILPQGQDPDSHPAERPPFPCSGSLPGTPGLCLCSHWPVPSGIHGLFAAVLHTLGFLLMALPHCFSLVFIATHQLSLSHILLLLSLLHLFA